MWGKVDPHMLFYFRGGIILSNPKSKCARMTVHAIGIDSEGNIKQARNGNKSRCRNIEGNCGCKHAEIVLLESMPNPRSVMVSHSPCINCAKELVKAGVIAVSYLKPYRLIEGIQYLEANGVEVQQIGDAYV
jgi:deoxycytidylate deaminase